MPEPPVDMRSANAALTWEIWIRNRRWVACLVALLLVDAVFDVVVPGSAIDPHNLKSGLVSTLGIIALLILFGMFNYTERDSRTGLSGFPHRLFTLPVSSFRLVSVPLTLGVVVVVLFGLTRQLTGGKELEAIAVMKAVTFMVVYQTVLWTCTRLGALRPILLAVIAMTIITMGIWPAPSGNSASPWSPETLIPIELAVITLGAFLLSWLYVSNQRSGGGRLKLGYKPAAEWIEDALPRRIRSFSSGAAAQFWFEWRCSGVILPICVGGVLFLLVGPVAWYFRDEPNSGPRILGAIIAMPLILAMPIGKGLSKPDFWSPDLVVPPFLSVRPLSTEDFVVIKLKVAALSAALAWLLTLVFLSVWLPLGANFGSLNGIRRTIHSLYGESSYAPYVIAVLFVIALLLLTWRFLVGSFWIGLSGSKPLFTISVLPYGFVPVLGLIGLVVVSRRSASILGWLHGERDNLLSLAVGILVLVAVAKFAVAILYARGLTRDRVVGYLMIWFAGTVLLVSLALLLSEGLAVALPLFSGQIRWVLVLIGVMIIPIARLGLTSSLLERNRHG